MNFRPLYDRILVKRVIPEAVSKGGIVLPSTAKDKPQEATVVAVGQGKVLEDGSVRPLAVQVGDRVLFGKYSGDAVTVVDEEHVVLREEDVLGVFK